MLRIGLTTWGEHKTLTSNGHAPTLQEYGGIFPVVELDTPYYGIPRQTTAENWLLEVPKDFRFLLKANQKMTGQKELEEEFLSDKALFDTYKKSLGPIRDAGKLGGILFQYPASFHCNSENVSALRKVADFMLGWPVVIEFRHASWYEGSWREKMYEFMEELNFSVAVIDEPQVANQSVPFDCHVTNSNLAVFRLHGRNRSGWQAKGGDWRKQRTLYCYNEEELQFLAKEIQKVAMKVKETIVIFNNNSGGDAAANALRLKEILGIEYQNLNPKQMSLFD